jgi:hypothetical protein
MFRHYHQNGHAWLDTSAPPISLGTIDRVPSVQYQLGGKDGVSV